MFHASTEKPSVKYKYKILKELYKNNNFNFQLFSLSPGGPTCVMNRKGADASGDVFITRTHKTPTQTRHSATQIQRRYTNTKKEIQIQRRNTNSNKKYK